MINGVKKTYELDSDYGGTYTVRPVLNMYANNDNLYVGLEYEDPEFGGWAPYGSVTVNICDLPYLHAAIDTNDNGPGIASFLEKNGFGQLSEFAIPSGMCVYPVFVFDEAKLMEIDAKTFGEYAKLHGMDKASLNEQIKTAAGKTEAGNSQPGKEPER